jgi:hypothetical protein
LSDYSRRLHRSADSRRAIIYQAGGNIDDQLAELYRVERRDSQTIPGVIMADVRMAVRATLRDQAERQEGGDVPA